MIKKIASLFIIVISSTLLLSATFPDASGQTNKILVITVNGVINPVSAEFIRRNIKKADEMQAEALVIKLDTPGGLDTSMRRIVKDIIGSKTPVIVFVSPSGARAASAGVFIILASHVAAMAPGTNIGAAHPVSIGEKMDKTMAEKVTNDAAAYIKSLAERTGRNAEWAEDAVRKSISATESEALKKKVIDIVSKDLNALLKDIDGREITTVAGKRKLRTSNASIITEEMGLRDKILNFISDPSVAYMLMLLGFYGLFFELTSPGAIFPGVMGTIFLILAFYAFQTLPVNYAGVLLILLALVLFILEIKVVSYGMLTIGGIITMVIGSLMLFESKAPFLRVSIYVILPAVISTALFFTIIFGLAYKAFKRKPVTGSEGLIGLNGKTMTDLTGEEGMVSIHGEIWSANSDETINKGDDIVVISVSGLKLNVKKKEVV